MKKIEFIIMTNKTKNTSVIVKTKIGFTWLEKTTAKNTAKVIPHTSVCGPILKILIKYFTTTSIYMKSNNAFYEYVTPF